MKLVALAFVLILSGCAGKQEVQTDLTPLPMTAENQRPKNVILLIGDGMGLSQITAAMYETHDSLNLMRFNNIGFIRTHSADNLVTDSGAGGTAFATGKKTKNYSIGVDAEGQPQETLLEMAEERGLATGLLVTSSITHATPAAFYAHVPNRDQEEDIAEALVEADVDIFVGGGQKFFSQRTDEKDLIWALREKGYDIREGIKDVEKARKGPVAGFISEEDPQARHLGREEDVLLRSWNAAMRVLMKDDDGFFLMVEGSQIDWGGHAKHLKYVTTEVKEFDRVVGSVLQFAQATKNTLVIVTADHETGGLGLIGGNREAGTVEPGWIGTKHTATMVPVFAYGPGAEQFRGIYENTDINEKIKALLFGE